MPRKKATSRASRRIRQQMSPQDHRDQSELIRQHNGPEELAQAHDLLARWGDKTLAELASQNGAAPARCDHSSKWFPKSFPGPS
jgi:hypothetical protein